MDETAHCMHLEENVDLWYLSEIFFSLRNMSIYPAYRAHPTQSRTCAY